MARLLRIGVGETRDVGAEAVDPRRSSADACTGFESPAQAGEHPLLEALVALLGMGDHRRRAAASRPPAAARARGHKPRPPRLPCPSARAASPASAAPNGREDRAPMPARPPPGPPRGRPCRGTWRQASARCRAAPESRRTAASSSRRASTSRPDCAAASACASARESSASIAAFCREFGRKENALCRSRPNARQRR